MTRPRLLLIPTTTELEWVIRPQLQEWADVLSFNAPGIGREPAPERYDSSAIAELAAAKVQERGWDGCVVAADEFSAAAALKFAARHRSIVQGMALGHAALSFSPQSDPPAVNAEVRAAFAQVTKLDDRTFVRHISQVTQGQFDDELGDRLLEDLPPGVGQAYLSADLADSGEWIEDALRALDRPLLLAAHEPCLLFTREGYDAAVAAFPDAMRVTCVLKPNVSPEFADALREFCASLGV